MLDYCVVAIKLSLLATLAVYMILDCVLSFFTIQISVPITSTSNSPVSFIFFHVIGY